MNSDKERWGEFISIQIESTIQQIKRALLKKSLYGRRRVFTNCQGKNSHAGAILAFLTAPLTEAVASAERTENHLVVVLDATE